MTDWRVSEWKRIIRQDKRRVEVKQKIGKKYEKEGNFRTRGIAACLKSGRLIQKGPRGEERWGVDLRKIRTLCRYPFPLLVLNPSPTAFLWPLSCSWEQDEKWERWVKVLFSYKKPTIHGHTVPSLHTSTYTHMYKHVIDMPSLSNMIIYYLCTLLISAFHMQSSSKCENLQKIWHTTLFI